MRLRCDANTGEGTAMTVGVYDDARRRGVVSRRIPAGAIRGSKYRLIDLGVHSLGKRMYAWAAPVVRNRGEVDAVYVDRVFLIRRQ
jgi:hypothetical protein